MTSRLLALNGVAILCVILFHATGFGFTAMFSWAHRYRPVTSPNYDEMGSAAYYALRLVEQFVVFCIPAFLFVSGFFVSVLAGRSRAHLSIRTAWGRVKSLLWPYLFWSAVVLLLFALQGRILSPGRYLTVLLTGAGPNYYYVPLLVQLYLLGPLIVLLVKRHGVLLLVCTAALQVVVYGLQYVAVVGVDLPIVTKAALLLPKWLFAAHLFWFTSGVVAGFEQQALKRLLTRTRWVWPVLAACLFVLGVVEWELLLRWSGSPWRENRVTLIDGLYAGSVILSFLAFADVPLPWSRTLSELGIRSYGIYLVHGIVMEYFARGVYHVAPGLLGRQILFQPMVIALGLAVPLALMEAVRRSRARVAYAYIFG